MTDERTVTLPFVAAPTRVHPMRRIPSHTNTTHSRWWWSCSGLHGPTWCRVVCQSRNTVSHILVLVHCAILDDTGQKLCSSATRLDLNYEKLCPRSSNSLESRLYDLSLLQARSRWFLTSHYLPHCSTELRESIRIFSKNLKGKRAFVKILIISKNNW